MSLYGTADMVALLSPIIVVAAAILVPMLDLVMAVRRVSKGQSPFAADKMHLHHRLLSLGHTHRRVALVLYLWVSAGLRTRWPSRVVPAKVAVAGTVVAFIRGTCHPGSRQACAGAIGGAQVNCDKTGPARITIAVDRSSTMRLLKFVA